MYKKLNYAIGDVASTTAIDATTLTLKAGHTITTDTGATNKFIAVFYDGTKSSPYQDTNREIVEAYRTNTNDFVIARAKENTSAKEWVENDKFMLIASAGVFNEYETEIASKEDALGYTAENVANKKTSLTDNSDTYYPTQKAVKTAVDAKQDTLTFGIANTNAVKIDDAFVADNDYAKFTANGIEGVPYSTVLSDIGAQAALGYTPENAANKKTTITSSDTDYPTCKAVETGLAAKQASLGYTAEDASNKETTALDTSTTKYPCNNVVKEAVDAKQDSLGYIAENVDNKVTSFQATPTDTAYASEKLVKDSLDAKLAITNKATSSDINGGTDNDKYITPDALAGSNFGTKPVQQYCVEWGTELAVEDGVGYIEIPAECNGMNLISARARVGTAGVTGNTTFDIYNVTDSHSMLSSAISIASGATSGNGTVDTAHDDVETGDIIRIDCDGISTTPPKGLIVTLAFRL